MQVCISTLKVYSLPLLVARFFVSLLVQGIIFLSCSPTASFTPRIPVPAIVSSHPECPWLITMSFNVWILILILPKRSCSYGIASGLIVAWIRFGRFLRFHIHLVVRIKKWRIGKTTYCSRWETSIKLRKVFVYYLSICQAKAKNT